MQGYFCSLRGRSISKKNIHHTGYICLAFKNSQLSSLHGRSISWWRTFCSTIQAFHRARSRNIEADKNTGSPSEGRPVSLATASRRN